MPPHPHTPIIFLWCRSLLAGHLLCEFNTFCNLSRSVSDIWILDIVGSLICTTGVFAVYGKGEGEGTDDNVLLFNSKNGLSNKSLSSL